MRPIFSDYRDHVFFFDPREAVLDLSDTVHVVEERYLDMMRELAWEDDGGSTRDRVT